LDVVRTEAALAATNLRRLRAVLDRRAVAATRLDAAQAAAASESALVKAAAMRVQGDQAQAKLARAQVETAEASLALAKGSLAQANLNLSYTKISAVVSGTVANKLTETGNYVQPGQLLFSVVPNEIYVVANYKETQLRRIRPGQRTTIRVDAYPSVRFRGHIDSIQRGTGSRFALLPPENATGNFVKVVQRIPVKIVFDGPAEALGLLSPGMSVEVKVSVPE
jgi:membrane fusion protein, multidrug efflux system